MTNLLLISGDGDLTFGTILGLIIVFGCYIAICACVGKFAKNRGRSFLLFFILSLLNPFLGFIIAALAGETKSSREERIRRETQIKIEEEYRYRQQYCQTQPLYNAQETDKSSNK